jgi:lipopolysaccharide/colanic/teichoic acid biosynthesis glycosyltransferase
MHRWALGLLLLAAAVLFTSCKDATQVNVVLRTNVPYATGVGVALWSSRSVRRSGVMLPAGSGFGLAMLSLSVEHDLAYIENWSLWLDAKCLFLTVFGRKVRTNAY